MARKKRHAPDAPSLLNTASENLPNVPSLNKASNDFTTDKSDNLKISPRSTITSFADLKRPPPKHEQQSKPRTFGFSLLRNKTSHSSSIDHRNNVSRAHSFLSVPLSQQKSGTLPINIDNLRRSPSPKSYPAPPVPSVTKSNHANDKIYNLPSMPKLSPKKDKIKRNVEENKANTIQFKLISTEERILLENDVVDLDDEKFLALGGDFNDPTTRLSSPDSSRQSVSQDSGVVSDIDVKDYETTTPIPSVSTSININGETTWNPPRYSLHNSSSYGRHSSVSGGDTFSSRSGSGSSEDSDSTDAGSEPSLTSYPDTPTSIRSVTSSIQNGPQSHQSIIGNGKVHRRDFPAPPPPPPPPAFQDWSLSYNPENNYPDSLSPPPPPSPVPAMSYMSTSSTSFTRLDEIISIRGTLRRTKKEKSDSGGEGGENHSNENEVAKYQYHMRENHCPAPKDFSSHDVDDYESELNFAGVKVVMSSSHHRSLCDNSSSNVNGDNMTTTVSSVCSGNNDNDTLYNNGCNTNEPTSPNAKQQTTIRSHRGTVRGVRNRVRQGIATFLLRDPTLKSFADTEKGKIVMYITTLGVVRDHLARCQKIRHILRTLLIRVEERDIFMCKRHQVELKDRLNAAKGIKRDTSSSTSSSKAGKYVRSQPSGSCQERLEVPQLFIEGQFFGDAETVENLNETGELRQILRPFKSLSVTSVCQKCGGFGLLPCPICNGSKKSVHRNNFTERFVALRCSNCDESALVKCDAC